MNTDIRRIDALRLHPDAEKVPRPSSADLRALRDSLRDEGQQDPIDITADDQILDGRTRWELLRDLGALDIEVRVHDLPESDQTGYIIARALTRRHLTNEQKRALNDLMRAQVVEVVQHKKTGEEMRIGRSQTERAATLGVDRKTVENWDLVGASAPTSPAPTHAIDARGRPNLLHKPPREPRDTAPVPRRLAIPRPKRESPPWLRHYTKWCRAVLPEDRPYLAAMSKELHQALGQIGLSCNGTEEK